MKKYKNLEPAYSVSGGDKSFDTVVYEGEKFLGIQFYYTSLSQADNKVRLQESIDGNNFVDSKDADGATIEMTIDNSLEYDILNIDGFNTAHFRLQFIAGTAGTGTFDSIKFLME